MLFADLLSLHLVTILMFFILVNNGLKSVPAKTTLAATVLTPLLSEWTCILIRHASAAKYRKVTVTTYRLYVCDETSTEKSGETLIKTKLKTQVGTWCR